MMNCLKSSLTLYETLKNSANKYSKKVAIYFDNSSITYKELVSKVDEISKILVTNNVKPNSVVTIVSHNNIETIAMFYAINKIGAVANILHYGVSVNEIVSSLELTNSRFLYTDRIELKEEINVKKNLNLFIFPNLILKKIQNRKIEPLCKDCSVILYTSGSTSTPKGIMFQNHQFNAFFEQSKDFYPDITSNDTVLVTLPLFHGFGLATGIHNNLALGASIIILSGEDKKHIDNIFELRKPSFIIGVPSFFELLIQNDKIVNKSLTYVKKILIGGAPTYNGYERDISAFFEKHNSNPDIQVGYGLTEALSGVTLNKPQKIKGVGIPFKNNQIKIINKKGYIGEICVKGPTLMIGYLNAKSTIDNEGWLHTGDLGYLKDDNLFIIGRSSRTVSVSGYSVSLDNIEEKLSKNKLIQKTAVISVPDKIRGNIVIAFIITKLSEIDVIKYCKSVLPIFAIPEIRIVNSIPLTSTGKINYQKLKGLVS